MRFGKLTVIEQVENNLSNESLWRCKCDCGKEKIIPSRRLNNNHGTRSCGCLREDVWKSNGKNLYKHGLSRTRLYKIWSGMHDRCCRKTDSQYKYYGGRGIKICDEWVNDFLSFYEWSMSNGYSDNLSIDRIDVNGDYSPDNCRWADQLQQANNKRNNIVIEIDGVKKTLPEWARQLGTSKELAYTRIANGWNQKDAVTKKPKKTRMYEYDGVKHTSQEWAEITGLYDRTIVRQRVDKLGWSVEKAVTTPVRKIKKGGG